MICVFQEIMLKEVFLNVDTFIGEFYYDTRFLVNNLEYKLSILLNNFRRWYILENIEISKINFRLCFEVIFIYFYYLKVP